MSLPVSRISADDTLFILKFERNYETQRKEILILFQIIHQPQSLRKIFWADSLFLDSNLDNNCDHALVAQLDRALDYESRGQEFESSRARHFPSMMQILHSSLIVI